MCKKNDMRRGNDACPVKVDERNSCQKLSAGKSIALILLLVITALLVSGFMDIFRSSDTEWVQQTYVVSEGDTLWSIGQRVKAAGDERDIREIVFELRRQNKLENYIRPGDEVKIWAEVLKHDR